MAIQKLKIFFITITVESYLTNWIDNFDVIGPHKVRKISSYSICLLWQSMSCPESLVGQIFCNMLDVLHDLKRPSCDSAMDYIYEQFQDELERFSLGDTVSMMPYKKRMHELDKRDICYTLNFVQHVRNVCQEFSKMSVLEESVDLEVLEQMGNLKL